MQSSSCRPHSDLLFKFLPVLNPFDKKYSINSGSFQLLESQFDHHSILHGILHTYRVMFYTLNLGLLTGHIHEARTAFFAAFVHDMARRHDGYCTGHGADAARLKLPLYHRLFSENGASGTDFRLIEKAVTLHSTSLELTDDDPDFLTVAILKDADALDRIRLGAGDLNPGFLRIKETLSCIAFAEALYHQSHGKSFLNFEDFVNKQKPLIEK